MCDQNDEIDSDILTLLETFQSGDQLVFDNLCKRYQPLVQTEVQSAYHRYRSVGAETDDLFQEASLALFNAALTYRREQRQVTFGLYAKICIHNRLCSVGRKLFRRSRADAAAKAQVSTAVRDVHGRTVLFSESVVGLLSEYERRIYDLYVSGMKYAQIAERLGMPLKSVDNAIYRIRKKIRKRLD